MMYFIQLYLYLQLEIYCNSKFFYSFRKKLSIIDRNIILIFSNFRSKIKIVNLRNWTIKHLILPSIISITSYGSWLHFDTGAYHLNYQYWLKTS